MANLWIESFGALSTADAAMKYPLGTNVTIDTTHGPRGGRCYKSSSATSTGSVAISPTLTGSTAICGIRHYAIPSIACAIIRVGYNTALSTYQCSLTLGTDGSIGFYRGDTANLLWSSAAGLITSGVWYFFEIEVLIGSGTSGSFKVFLNGNQLVSLTGQNTQGQAAATWAGIRCNAGPYSYLADWYINDGSGSAPDNAAWGDTRIEAHFPNGNGATSGWTGSDSDQVDNYALVDETEKNSNTDYVSTTTLNAVDTYAFENLKHTGATVRSCQVNFWHEKATEGPAIIAPVCRPASTDRVGTTVYPAAGTYTISSQLYPLNPEDSSAWDETDFNATEWGVKKTG